jgi:hypothetical protein
MNARGHDPAFFEDPNLLADAIIARVGNRIELALPLGLGKANHGANALFARAAAGSSIWPRVFTALTFELPRARNDLCNSPIRGIWQIGSLRRLCAVLSSRLNFSLKRSAPWPRSARQRAETGPLLFQLVKS